MFVNADKTKYKKYHEQLIEIVKLGGIISYQNTLCSSSVASEEEVTDEAIVDFNNSLASDERIEISQLPIGDGLTLCMRMI